MVPLGTTGTWSHWDPLDAKEGGPLLCPLALGAMIRQVKAYCVASLSCPLAMKLL